MIGTLYEKYCLPYLIDLACGLKPMHKQREKVVPKATGRVLEIGIGTGLNMRYYDQHKVQELIGIDPAVSMHRLAQKRIDRAGLSVKLVGLPAEKIPLDDNSIDTIVMTYTLCTIPEPVLALKEMRRVLAPEGRLLFVEHGKSPDAHIHRLQNRLQPVWGPLAGGCHLGRDIPALLKEAGFQTDQFEQMYVPGPKVFTYNYWGSAYCAD